MKKLIFEKLKTRSMNNVTGGLPSPEEKCMNATTPPTINCFPKTNDIECTLGGEEPAPGSDLISSGNFCRNTGG